MTPRWSLKICFGNLNKIWIFGWKGRINVPAPWTVYLGLLPFVTAAMGSESVISEWIFLMRSIRLSRELKALKYGKLTKCLVSPPATCGRRRGSTHWLTRFVNGVGVWCCAQGWSRDINISLWRLCSDLDHAQSAIDQARQLHLKNRFTISWTTTIRPPCTKFSWNCPDYFVPLL